MRLFLRELAAYWRFLFGVPRDAKAVVFYSEHSGYTAYLEGLVDELERRGQPLSYVTSDPNDPILERQRAGFHAFYIARLLPLFMLLVNCRVIAMTLTDLHQLQLKRSINPVHYVYVFHSLHSIHMTYRDGSFDHYDSILCVGPHQITEFREYERQRGLKEKFLVEAGYYRLERILAAHRERRSGGAGRDRAKGLVLVAPSWAASNLLEAHGVQLVATLRQSGYQVIMRPHPELTRRRPQLIAEFERAFGEDPGVTLETSVAGDDSLLEADLLITDWSAIALEFAFGTERPVLYIDTPRKVFNQRYEELSTDPIEVSLRPLTGRELPLTELDRIDRAVDELMAEAADLRPRLIELRDRYVFALGRSSAVGADHIQALLVGSAAAKTDAAVGR